MTTSATAFSPTTTGPAGGPTIDLTEMSDAALGERGTQNGNPTRARARPTLLAAGGAPVVTAAPVKAINTWAVQTIKAIQIRPGAQPLVPKAGQSALVPAPVVTIPVGATRTNLQTKIFPAGSSVLTLRGVPRFDGNMSADKTRAIEASLTDPLIREFAKLSPTQKALARTWMAAVFQNMNLAPNDVNYIATSQLPETLKYVLKLAQASGAEAKPTAATRVRPGAAPMIETTPSTTGKRSVPVAPDVGQRPQASAPRIGARPVPKAPVLPTTPAPQTDPAIPRLKPTVDGTLRANQSLGKLGTQFGANLNPALREVMEEITSGQLRIKRFDANADPAEIVSGVQERLTASKRVAAADLDSASTSAIALARELDVDPVRLVEEISTKDARLNALATGRNSAQPQVVDGVLQPQSVHSGDDWMTAMMSRGVVVPPRSQTVRLQTGNGFSMTESSVEHGKKLLTTQLQSDIDGVWVRPNYGPAGIEIGIQAPKGGPEVPVYIKLDRALAGEPERILSVRPDLGRGEPVVVIAYETKIGSTTETRRESFVVQEDDAALLSRARGLGARVLPISGLSTRYFSPGAINFLVNISDNNLRGGQLPGGIILPTMFLNSFGMMGDPTNPNGITGPGALARSMGRSQAGNGQLEARGIEPVKGLPVISGGLVETKLSAQKSLSFFMSVPALEKGIKGVAAELPTVMQSLAVKYQLSDGAARDLQNVGFLPHSPITIIPASVAKELVDRQLARGPGGGLSDLQRDIETEAQALVKKHGLSDYIDVHHTPHMPGTVDDVAYFGDAAAKGTVTREWQFAVKAQKALGVLNMVGQASKEYFGFDLKAPLAAMGYDDKAIRKMGLNEVITFLAEKVRPLLVKNGVNLGKIIVPIDTYVEKGGVVSGSDASLVRASAALYGAENTAVLQVDTHGGNPAEMGKPARFRVDVRPDGKVYVAEPSVDPAGPNGRLAPTAYVVRPEEFGSLANSAYDKLQRITAGEIRAVRNRANN